MTDYKVSVIIPNYNGEELLKKNLPHILKSAENKENGILEIIVVDDFSSDGSVSLIKEKFPKVRLIKHTKNRGFSAAVNTGARSARGRLLALINTDVRPETGFLIKVFPLFANDNVFAVSLHEEGYGWAKGVFKDGFISHAPGEESRENHISFWVSGGSGIFRRDYWMWLGGMDEKLFSPYYWEDLDICYRAQKRGLITLWEPEAKVVHEHQSTINKLPQSRVNLIRERNQLLLNWKDLTSSRLTRKHIAGLAKRMAKHPGYIRVFLSALNKLGAALSARRKEKKEAKISDEAIFSRFA